MKIVHVISGLDVGGAEIFLEQLILFWPNARDEHIVIAFHGGVIADRLRSKNIQIYEMRSHKSWDLFFAEKTAWRVHKLLGQLKPDVVISALWSANILMRPLCFAHGIPLISVLHNKASFLSLFKQSLDVLSAVFFSHTRVAVSADVACSYVAFPLLGGLSRPPVVIQNGIDVDGLVARVELSRTQKPLWQNKFIFGAVGRFIPEKQMLVLICAFNEFVQQLLASGKARADLPCVCMVGDGPQFAQARALVKELGIWDVVLLVGKQVDLAPYYASFSAYISVSQSEGLSIALLEALAVGLPVIISQQSGAANFLPSPDDGLLVDVHNQKAIVAALAKMYQAHTTYAARAHERTNYVRENYSITRTSQEYALLVKLVV